MARDDDGAAVGFAFVSPAPLSSDWDRPAVYVEDIAVAPGARGGGIGSRLLAAVREHAGDREVRLSVLAANHDARRFYAREGFVEFIHQLVLRPARAVSPPQPARDGSLPSQVGNHASR